MLPQQGYLEQQIWVTHIILSIVQVASYDIHKTILCIINYDLPSLTTSPYHDLTSWTATFNHAFTATTYLVSFRVKTSRQTTQRLFTLFFRRGHQEPELVHASVSCPWRPLENSLFLLTMESLTCPLVHLYSLFGYVHRILQIVVTHSYPSQVMSSPFRSIPVVPIHNSGIESNQLVGETRIIYGQTLSLR